MRFRLAQVILNPSTGIAPYGASVSFEVHANGATAPSFTIPLQINNSYYFPTYLTDLTRLFSFYYMNSASLHYEPRQPTDAVVSYVAATVQDPEWFESHGLLFGSGEAVPTETALVSRETACTNIVWAPCDWNFEIDSKVKYFVAGTSRNSAINYNTENPATIRQSVAGTAAIASIFQNTNTNKSILGDVYAWLDLELCEFSLANTSNISLSVAKAIEMRCKDDVKERFSDQTRRFF